MPRKPLRALPMHHIDTSVLLEPHSTRAGRLCKKYLQRVGRKYRGIVSAPVLSELAAPLLTIEEYVERHELLDLLYYLLRERKIGLYWPRGIGGLISKLQKADPRIEPTDRLIVACAIEHKADALVSMDKKLAGNTLLKEKFKLTVVEPLQV